MSAKSVVGKAFKHLLAHTERRKVGNEEKHGLRTTKVTKKG